MVENMIDVLCIGGPWDRQRKSVRRDMVYFHAPLDSESLPNITEVHISSGAKRDRFAYHIKEFVGWKKSFFLGLPVETTGDDVLKMLLDYYESRGTP